MKNREIILKLVDYVNKIENYCAGKTYEQFSGDSLLAEACIFNLSQIGELVNRLDEVFLEENATIPWHQIRGLRNRIVHDYEGVNLILVWEVISRDLPELRDKLLDI